MSQLTSCRLDILREVTTTLTSLIVPNASQKFVSNFIVI